MERLQTNLQNVRQAMAEASMRAGRKASDTTLIAVTKRTPEAWARALVELGEPQLGENYPQELWSKSEILSDLPQIQWHLIGHLQTNKLKRTLPLVTMIHAVDKLDLLVSIGKLMPVADRLQRICLQVNMSGESSKHGWDRNSILAEAESIAHVVNQFEIPVKGLMTMAAWGTDADSARPAFSALRELAEEFSLKSGLAMPDLSMGMSGDFESAIEEGATFVRVGSALFEGLVPT